MRRICVSGYLCATLLLPAWLAAAADAPPPLEVGVEPRPESPQGITVDFPELRKKLTHEQSPLWLQYLPDVRMTIDTPTNITEFGTARPGDLLHSIEFLSPWDGIWMGYRLPNEFEGRSGAATFTIKRDF